MTDGAVDYAQLDPLIAPIARQRVEFCILLYLGDRERLVGLRHVRGSRTGIEIPVRLLVADALAFDASGAIMAHNHPGGDASPSEADFAITRRLARAFKAVGVTLIDHLLLAGDVRTSLRTLGHL